MYISLIARLSLEDLNAADRLTAIFRGVIITLGDAHGMKSALRDMRFEQGPDDERDIFGRWNNAAQFRHVEIEVLVIERTNDYVVHQLPEFFQVDDITRLRIGNARDRYLDRVIVSVPTDVITLIEDSLVLLVGICWIVEPVRGGKMSFACDVNHVAANTSIAA